MYSAVKRRRVTDLIDELKEKGEDPLNLVEDLYLIRAMAIDFVNRYDEYTEALINWNKSWQNSKEPEKARKPTRVYDISHAVSLIREATRVVKLVHDIRNQGSITMRTFKRLMEQMALTVARYVKDGKTLRRIERDWGLIQLDDQPSGVRPASSTGAARAVGQGSGSGGETVH
jgi:hypothetical protein